MIGARVKNTDRGTVFIDQNYSNLCLREIKTVNLPGGGYDVIHTSTFTTSSGIVAFSGGPFRVLRVDQQGDNAVYSMSSAGNINVTAYVFDSSHRSPLRYYSEPFGLRIRNPDTGVIVFDSRNKYMKVLDYIHALQAEQGTKPPDKSYAKKIAVVQGFIPFVDVQAGMSGGGGQRQTIWYFLETSGGNLYCRQFGSGSLGGSEIIQNIQTAYNFLVLDVSGF